MKKFILTAAFAVGALLSTNAQDNDALAKGKWLVEANTGFGEASRANTSFNFLSIDGESAWGIGAEGGYFVIDNLAVKAGLGYADGFGDDDGTFNWKVGAKYYIASQFPVQVDVNGSSVDGFSPLFVGIQGGYAWFVADNVSIEPGIRYGLGLNEEAGDGDFNPLSLNIGFAIFF